MSQRVRIRKTTKGRVKKGTTAKGYRPCNMCHGTGKIKVKS